MNKGNKFPAKKIKEIVGEKLKHMEKPEIDDVIEMIRPLYAWEKNYLVERELKKTARAIMRSFKDKNGVRTYFSGNKGVYINVEKSTDLDDLYKVNKQLEIKHSGLSVAIEKVCNRIRSIVDKYSGANSSEG